MLFCIYEVFEAVNTAGLSLKMVRYCFGLKRNPGFGFKDRVFMPGGLVPSIKENR